MKYDIFRHRSVNAKTREIRAEIGKILLYQALKDMRETLFPTTIAALAARLNDVQFMFYPI